MKSFIVLLACLALLGGNPALAESDGSAVESAATTKVKAKRHRPVHSARTYSARRYTTYYNYAERYVGGSGGGGVPLFIGVGH